MTDTPDPTSPPPAPASPAPAVLRAQRSRVLQTCLLSVLLLASGGVGGWCLARFLPPPHGMPGGMGPPDPPVDRIVEQLQDELSLSDAQTKKVETIYQERFAALKAIREEMSPKLTAQYTQLKTEMQGVLSAEQFGMWDKRFENVRNRMLPPPPPRRGPHGPDDMGGPPPRDGDGPPPGDRGGPPGRDGPGNDGPPPPR